MGLTLAVVLIYLVAVIGIIVYTGKKVKTYYDFALGGGSIPWFVIAGSMFASTVGGATMIGYVGNYKAYGLQWGLVPFLSFSVGSLIVALLIAPRLRKLNQYTTADLFGIRYGKKTKIIAGALLCIGEFAVVVSMTSSFMTMANGYLGIPIGITLVLAVVIFYVTATMGGLKGVAYTDLIQAVAIIITVAIIVVICIVRVGASGESIPKELFNPFAENMSWKTMSGNIISSIGLGMVSQSLLVQRINSVDTAENVKKATLLNAILNFVFMCGGIGAIGLCSAVLTSADVTGNAVITELLKSMPTIVAAFYCAAILAAVLTTANSLLLSSSMAFVRDVVGSCKKLDDKQQIKLSRIYMAVALIIAALLVQFCYSSVIGWILITYTIMGTLAIPLYAGLLSKKTTPMGGFLGLLLGGGISLIFEVLKLINVLPASITVWHSIFPGIVLGIVGLLIGNRIGKSTPEQEKVVDCFKNMEDYHGNIQA